MEKGLDSYVGQYFRSSPTYYFKVKSINKGLIGEETVLSINTISYVILAGMLCIDYTGFLVRELNFDFESIRSSKEELLSFIEKYI